MPAFAPIAFIDTFALAASLERRWGLFKDEPEHPGLRLLRLRGTAKGAEESDDRFGVYPGAKGWVEYNNLRSEIARRAEQILPPGVEFGRIFFTLLDPGARLDWTVEAAPYFLRWTRAVLPIRTNPATLLVYGTETASPGPGFLTIVSPRLPHCALNLGETPWVNLVLDFRRKAGDQE